MVWWCSLHRRYYLGTGIWLSSMLFNTFIITHTKYIFTKSLVLTISIWQMYNSFPQLMRRLPGPHQRYIQIWAHTMDFIRDELEKHKQSWDPSDPRDYIDCFLNEIQVVNDTGHRVALLLCCLVKLLCICFSTPTSQLFMMFHCGTSSAWHGVTSTKTSCYMTI